MYEKGQATKWDAPAHKRNGAADWWELFAKDHHFLRTRWRNLHQLDEMMWQIDVAVKSALAQTSRRDS